MAAKIVALNAYLAGLTNSNPSEKARDACDAVTSGSTSTCPSHHVGTLVAPVSASRLPNLPDDEAECKAGADVDLEEREAMALEGGVPPAFARVFAALQVARPASVDEHRWREAINDVGIFLDRWGRAAERLGWTARDIIGPQFTPCALAWALQGAHVIGLTRTTACLSDGRIFTRPVREACHDKS
jgi:hypothetical protein